MSFLVIDAIWLNHHVVFKERRPTLDTALQILNLLPSLMVTAIPFSARRLETFLLVHEPDAHLAPWPIGW